MAAFLAYKQKKEFRNMISRKRILKFAIGKMLHQDGWAEKYDQDNRFGINQYDYDSEKDYLFALQREWKNSIWDSDKVEKYVNVLDHTKMVPIRRTTT